MRRPSKAAGAPAKTRRLKGAKLKLPDALKLASRRSSSTASPDTEVARITRELDDALGQLAATSEVLRVISSSRSKLDPVFQSMLVNATRLCEANFGILMLHEGEAFRVGAMHNAPPAFAELRRREPVFCPGPLNPLARIAATKRLLHISNLAEDAAYKEREPAATVFVELAGARTVLLVPMFREEELIGAISIFRQEVRPFTEKQIALLQNFAAQAVIAIENARLLNELRQRTTDLTERTADLTEALEQQTATSEVLQVISSSPGDLQPVFASMLEKAVRICGAKFGTLYLHEAGGLRLTAAHDVPPGFSEARGSSPIQPSPGGGLDVAMRTQRTVHITDLAATQAYAERHPRMVEAVEIGGIRTVVAVPMLKDSELVGVIAIHRREVLPFTDKQIALVTNFAAQAVIAIENARLLNELRQRTADLTNSLEQQTATSDVLQIISSSPGELEPVFRAILENATRICGARFGMLWQTEGAGYRSVAYYGVPPALIAKREQEPVIFPGPEVPLARLAITKQVLQIADIRNDEGYIKGYGPLVALADVGAARTLLLVPMLKENDLLGVISIFRQEVRPFTDKEIELVKNFAAQAVIAIENARLLNELRERTGQLEEQSQVVAKLNQQIEQRVADQVGEIERMSRLRRFLPPQVADLIVASGAEKQLESHRREITALFCDLRGFTGFSESSDPEDVMALLRDYHAAIGEIIIKYSGTLERYAGDGVMVVFNDPVPVENPALQAVLMALEMRNAIGALTETWGRWGHDIGFGIGISHGFATLGTIGFEGRFDYAAIGTVSNVASRLCDEAKPGQILISPRVLTKVENAVKVEPVGEFALKGIRRPILAHNVLAAVSATP